MFEIDFELSGNAKKILSWMVSAELLKLVDNQRAILATHPFDGHYDCLTLSSYDEQHQILLNRLGENALAEGELVEFIWSRAAYSPRETALHIMSESEVPAGEGADFNLGAIKGAIRVAQFLCEDRSRCRDVIWGCFVQAEDVQVHPFLSEFSIPESWRSMTPPTASTSWSAWLWVLTHDENPEAIVNLMTGEVLNKKGRPWYGWTNESIEDDEGLPASTIAVLIDVVEFGSERHFSQLTRPAFARGTRIHLDGEGDSFDFTPLRELNSLEDVRSIWAELPG